ncbi:hypothetical protein K432DRAFT_160017 [Lepidopterella palustris CBS 459.81]|uniref:Uncharacterized protein n=1 Tax=Lepidopterella palustris CBS 459.81 TaxID=1314670 RepID=A0A8E2E1Y3_9PEZI|nr:hypothetical protein K432DRAFT_160017 [Lepidopterella palustris CBS 459.81]
MGWGFVEWEFKHYQTCRVDDLVEDLAAERNNGVITEYVKKEAQYFVKSSAEKCIRNGIKHFVTQVRFKKALIKAGIEGQEEHGRSESGISALLCFSSYFDRIGYADLPVLFNSLMASKFLDFVRGASDWLDECQNFYNKMQRGTRHTATT